MPSLADAAPGWVWAPELAAPGATLVLGAETAHHVVRVCRARPGDSVTLTDGRGGVARAELLDSGRETRVLVLRRRDLAEPPARVLLSGVPEGERADWLIEKVVELGVTALWPIDTERADWRRAGTRRDRWERLARAALGQSRRAWLTVLEEPAPLALAIERLPGRTVCWLADAAGEPAAGVRQAPSAPQAAVVGPSPGLTDIERESLLTRGFRAICLADGRLRAETAGLAVAAWWAAEGGPPDPDSF
jgi:16S rRNA (uracil1498-N3)-methyltransferase